jgi:hypothetical protein
MTSVDNRIIYRGASWPESVVPAAVLFACWLMKWNPYVTIGVSLAAVVVVQIVKPRGPGRWTE